MEELKQITVNENNRKYYSEEFLKGFECGAKRQLEKDKETILVKESVVTKDVVPLSVIENIKAEIIATAESWENVDYDGMMKAIEIIDKQIKESEVNKQ